MPIGWLGCHDSPVLNMLKKENIFFLLFPACLPVFDYGLVPSTTKRNANDGPSSLISHSLWTGGCADDVSEQGSFIQSISPEDLNSWHRCLCRHVGINSPNCYPPR